MDREAYYRTLDILFRVHQDLFHIEDAILRDASARIHLAEMRGKSVLGVAVAGTLAIVPIVVSVSGLEWNSLPIIWAVLVAIGLVGLFCWQISEAQKTARDLKLARSFYKRVPLERRQDYVLEQVHVAGTRIRVLDELIPELESRPSDPVLIKRIELWKQIRNELVAEIELEVEESADLAKKGEKSEEDHADVVDWAKPFLS